MSKSITYQELVDGLLSSIGIDLAEFWGDPTNYIPNEYGLCDEDAVYVYHLKSLAAIEPHFHMGPGGPMRVYTLLGEYAGGLGLDDAMASLAVAAMNYLVEATAAGDTEEALTDAAARLQLGNEGDRSSARRKWLRAASLALQAGNQADADAHLQNALALAQQLANGQYVCEHIRELIEHAPELSQVISQFTGSATFGRVVALQQALTQALDNGLQ